MSAREKARKIRRSLQKDLSIESTCGCVQNAEHLLFKTTRNVEYLLPHSLLPSHNVGRDWARLEELRNYPNCAVNSPRPVYVAKKHADLIDKCHMRSIDKSNHDSALQGSIQNSRRVIANRKKEKLKNQNIYSLTVFTTAENLEVSPDPYFKGNYDYYYTGGNLCVLKDETQHVLHSDEIESNKFKIDRFPSTKDFPSSLLHSVNTFTLNNVGEVYELRELQNLNRNSDVLSWFAARQRCNITLATFDAEKGNVSRKLEFKTNKTPFISFAQFPDNPQRIFVSTVKQQLRLYDLNSEKVDLYRIKADASDKVNYTGQITWNCVRPWKEKLFLYANRKQCYLCDLRTKPEEWLTQGFCGFNMRDKFCDMITSVTLSNLENLFYVGSYHKMHCMDIRFMGQGQSYFGDNNTLCSWTHQLEYPPIFVDTYLRGDEEFIAMSGPLADDIRICELTRSRSLEDKTPSYRSRALPWQPPTLEEAYEAACLAGKCLKPEIDMKKRIRCSTTGLAFYVLPEQKRTSELETLLLYSNSNGDVYSLDFRERRAGESEERTNEETIEIMDNYSKKICELTQPSLKYSQVLDVKGLRKILLCKNLSDLPPEDFPKEEKDENGKVIATRRKFGGGGWQRSIQSLHQFKDALAQDLLSIWDIEFNENEQAMTLSQLDKQIKKERNHKDLVTSWLVKNEEDQKPPPMLAIPQDIFNYSETSVTFEQTLPTTQDFAEQLQSTQVVVMNENDTTRLEAFDDDFNFALSPPQKKAKVIKGKKKYIKGF